MGIQRDIADYIRTGESSSQNLGLEIEHFVVNDEGNQIEFDEISSLIDQVGRTLFKKEKDDYVIFSTYPLTQDGWEELPMNQLMVYKDGQLVYTGVKHSHTYVQSEEDIKMLFMDYAGL